MNDTNTKSPWTRTTDAAASSSVRARRASRILAASCTLIIALTPLGCVGPTTRIYRRDVSTHSPLTQLKLPAPPENGKRAETPYMVAFVATRYETAMEDALDKLRRIYATPSGQESRLNAGAYRKMDVAKLDYFEDLRKSLQTDLEQLLLGKNIRVLGRFKTRDEMTFDEKKRALYAFTPEISITVDTKCSSSSQEPYTEQGDVIVNGVVTLTLRESITGEKLWLKRIEADPVSKPYSFVARHKEPYCVEQTIGVLGQPLSSRTNGDKDDTDQVLAAALSDFYMALGNKLAGHIDPEEWGKYRDQAEGLRKGKVY